MRGRRCATCDEWYDEHGPDATVHRHPEPQSGPYRDAWGASGLEYADWVSETPEGRAWVAATLQDKARDNLPPIPSPPADEADGFPPRRVPYRFPDQPGAPPFDPMKEDPAGFNGPGRGGL